MSAESDLENWFTHHPPRDEVQIADYQAIRSSGRRLAGVITGLCPPGTERDTALEKVREAVMWANAGIACGSGEKP